MTVGSLELVDGHGIPAAVDVQDEVLLSRFKDLEWSVVGALQWSTMSVLADVDEPCCSKVVWYIGWVVAMELGRWR